MQTRARSPKQNRIPEFRRDLRVLEREIVRQLGGETACCGVTLAQCHALLELADAELSLSSLAATLGLDVSTLSRTVDGLVRAGLVERVADDNDRRAVRLTLAPPGRAKAGDINTRCNRYYAALLGGMSEREQQCVLRAVRLLGSSMRSLHAGPGCALPKGVPK
jgi:DNA-binding MarR family transcriptional regulator